MDHGTPKPQPNRRRDFVIAYAFWLIVLSSIAVTVWLSSSELSAFRYAGF